MPHAEKGGNPELIRESQRRRYADVSLVDQVIELDNEWRNGACLASDLATIVWGMNSDPSSCRLSQSASSWTSKTRNSML